MDSDPPNTHSPSSYHSTCGTSELHPDEYYYEVSFKCSLKIYSSLEPYYIGDMVIISATGGSNIGFIYREVDINEIQQLSSYYGLSIPSKKILSKLKDGDETIRNILINKIMNERQALNKCQLIMRNHQSGLMTDIFATEFQFDNKKLTIFLKKQDEVSVCRLVRKLYETFKMKIKVVEVEGFEVLQGFASKYLEISRLDVSPAEMLNFPAATPTSSQYLSKYSTPVTRTSTYHNHPRPLNRHPHQHAAYHTSLYSQASPAALQSDLAKYGPNFQRYQQPGLCAQTESEYTRPPPVRTHSLLGPLVLFSPTSVAPTNQTSYFDPYQSPTAQYVGNHSFQISHMQEGYPPQFFGLEYQANFDPTMQHHDA